MSNSVIFDASLYTRPPQLNVASAVGLGTQLLVAMPKKPTASVHKAAKRLRTSILALQKAWGEAHGKAAAEDPRPADHAIDNAWSNCYQRLEAYANLPLERHPKAARAGELLAILFPDGLAFLKLPYEQEWAESEKRLDRIAKDKLEKELALFAGEEFVSELKHAHARYGAALGTTTKKEPAADPTRLVEPLRAATNAITFYTTQLAATVDPEEPETASAARISLAPVDELRQGRARRASRAGSGDATPPSPTSPVPDVPKV